MKKYARIFNYLKYYKGKLGLYLFCVLLSTLFGVISIGLLIPFLGLIFDTTALGGASVKKNALGAFITENLESIKAVDGKEAALIAICLFIISATLLKNIF